MLHIQEFSKLTTSMFSAAIGETSWENFLTELSRQSGDICTHIIGYDNEASITMDLVSSGYSSEFIETYKQYFGELNAWAPGFFAKPSGMVIDCEDMCPTEDLLKTEFYHDWLRPQEDIIQGGGTLLFKNDTRVFALGGNIRQKDEDKLKTPWLELVGLLIPQLQHAFNISRTLAGAKLETAIVANSEIRSIPGILIFSDTGRVIFANDIAENMLMNGIPVQYDLSGRVCLAASAIYDQIDSDHYFGYLRHEPSTLSLKTELKNQQKQFILQFAPMSADANIPLPLDAILGIGGNCTLLLIS